MAIAKMKRVEISKPSTLIANLQYLIDKAGISEAELSRYTNIPQPTLHKILSGKTTDPRISTLKILAKHFNVSIDQLLAGFSADFENQKIKTQPIPLISWENCIQGNSFTKNLTLTNWPNWVTNDWISPHVYGLISKPSMMPRFPKETILIISSDIEPRDGDLVVVHYPSSKEATIRELSIDGPTKLLLSINSTRQQDNIHDQIKIIGTLAQTRFSYY